jgi:hypothetical protein
VATAHPILAEQTGGLAVGIKHNSIAPCGSGTHRRARPNFNGFLIRSFSVTL